MWPIKVSVFVILAISFAACSENAVLCYYGSWATYRHGNGKFDVENIDPQLCTHVIYSFAGITKQGEIVSLDPYLDLPDNWGRDNFGKLNALKQKNPSLKTLLAIGGWNEGSGKYSIMAASAILRRNFINSAIKMLKSHGFDGLDLDWEYPNRRDTVYGQADINNFTQLLKELREVFDQHGFLLTAAVASIGEMASLSYDIPAISRYLDIINLMTYDMAGSWDATTGHQSNLFRGEGYDDDSKPENWYSVSKSLQYWINSGCPPEKIALGMPFYARTFRLAEASVNGVRARSSGAGLAGQFTATPGSMGYNEFCYSLKTETWSQRYDRLAEAPYAFKDLDWASYDNVESITIKINYAKALGINKVMMWSIETDDFRGLCGDGVNPLLNAINKALDNDKYRGDNTTTSSTTSTITSSATSTTKSPSTPTSTFTSTSTSTSTATSTSTSTTTTTEASTSTESPQNFVCKQEGFLSNPESCSSFYVCTRDSTGILKPNKFQCPANLLWDQDNLVCEYKHLVKCEES